MLSNSHLNSGEIHSTPRPATYSFEDTRLPRRFSHSACAILRNLLFKTLPDAVCSAGAYQHSKLRPGTLIEVIIPNG